VYLGPITVSSTETVEAIAVISGPLTSAVASAAYTINQPQAATPVFNPGAGTYSSAQTVTISTTTPGATIYFTTNGSTPTTASAVYLGPITVSANETVETIAAATGYQTSSVGSAAYIIASPASVPTFTPGSGTYTSAQTVTISTTTPGAAIYYTTNGTTPTTSSALYISPITVSSSETVEAIAVATGYSSSSAGSATYTLNLPAASFTVAVTPASLVVTAGQTGTATVMVTPQGTFNSPVTLSCSGLPSGASCSFAPATVTPTGAPASTTLTISTSATTAEMHRKPNPWFPGSALAVALCFLGWRKRRALPIVMLALVALVLSVCTGCTVSGSPTSQVTTQPTLTYVTVIGTSGSTQLTTSFSLTLQ
jgi:hypothetical protein